MPVHTKYSDIKYMHSTLLQQLRRQCLYQKLPEQKNESIGLKDPSHTKLLPVDDICKSNPKNNFGLFDKAPCLSIRAVSWTIPYDTDYL